MFLKQAFAAEIPDVRSVVDPSNSGLIASDSALPTYNVLDHWLFSTAIPDWISWLIIFAAGAAVLMIVIGGAMIIYGGSDEEWFTKGIKTITWAVFGVIISILSYTIVEIVNQIPIFGEDPLMNQDLLESRGNIQNLVKGDLRYDIIPQAIVMVLELVGLFTFVMLLYAGGLLVFRMGEDDMVEKAKGIIKWGILGLIIIAVSYVIVEGVSNLDFSQEDSSGVYFDESSGLYLDSNYDLSEADALQYLQNLNPDLSEEDALQYLENL